MTMGETAPIKTAGRRASPFVLLALVLAACFFAGREFRSMRAAEAIHPGPGLTEARLLSDYFPPLRGTPGDTPVFTFRGAEPGGAVLILGGTHPNEPAGTVTAVVLAETIRATRGTVVIVPRANASGFTHSDPQEASPQRYEIPTPSGPRVFRLGARVTNPVHQWPDPTVYVNPGGQELAGIEARNLNRAYPGRADGSLTERVAFAVMCLIRAEKVGLGIDLHESAPEYPVNNAIVFHESGADLAASAQMALQAEGFDFRLEASPPHLRGLSHREWGDAAGIMAVLIETPSASHGRLKGRPSAALVVDGRDKFYEKAAKLGRLFVPFGPEGIPLKERVARHLAAVSALIDALREITPEKSVNIENMPSAKAVLSQGIGFYLHPPN
jgi:hypothetical protein